MLGRQFSRSSLAYTTPVWLVSTGQGVATSVRRRASIAPPGARRICCDVINMTRYMTHHCPATNRRFVCWPLLAVTSHGLSHWVIHYSLNWLMEVYLVLFKSLVYLYDWIVMYMYCFFLKKLLTWYMYKVNETTNRHDNGQKSIMFIM